MNLYEFEGKKLLAKHDIKTPKSVLVRHGDDFAKAYNDLENKFGVKDVVVKAQVLSGKRGKNNGIKFCGNASEVVKGCGELFATNIRGQFVDAVLIEEKLEIAEEHYVSIVYDTNKKQPCLIYSKEGGMDIEDVVEEKIKKIWLDVREDKLDNQKIASLVAAGDLLAMTSALWQCFLAEDTRQVEINPLVKTKKGEWVAADAKIAIDEDAFFRHEEWKELEPRTMMGRLPTEREVAVKKIDEGEKYYQGTAGKYIELDGDIAMILNGGGASIANMDALISVGLKPANYTEYSGNPPREKVAALTRVVLSKPGLKGLWMCGVVANFTNIKETFLGIIDAIDAIKPNYPIVVRRDGPESAEGFRLLDECAQRNNLKIKMFNKDTGMSETAQVLKEMIESAQKLN